MGMDNDTRGWIMSVVSGIACTLGASIVCVDLVIRYIPGQRNFRIQDSHAFLVSSLSMSFGVMIFSALCDMLPSAKEYLEKDGFSRENAWWTIGGCFLGGAMSIQIIGRILHRYMPSHVVDCEHSHEEGAEDDHDHERNHSPSRKESQAQDELRDGNHEHDESAPLLSTHRSSSAVRSSLFVPTYQSATSTRDNSRERPEAGRRPSMMEVPQNVISFIKDTEPHCDSAGPCKGYGDTCGDVCFSRRGSRVRSTTFASRPGEIPTTIGEETEEGSGSGSSLMAASPHIYHRSDNSEETVADPEAQHHHHVPENEFLSIGLQTSIAIALHKLPEGFITYATNHANPSLGFSVFLALLVHNVSEGFAMALPLYLALGSRPRAMFWSSLLGGVSQPLGAGIAALWFSLAGRGDHTPGTLVYGCMFAITSGIMTSVALHLFLESVSLGHNRNLCIAFAFVGMSLMGISNALTSEH